MAPALSFVLVVLFLVVSGEERSGISWNDDVLGLLVFKAGLHDPQTSLGSWNEADASPCNWTGVRCSSSNGRVESLSLDNLSLSGTIGRGLLKLENLKTLSLSNNNLSGPIPSRLLGTLEFVDLKKNRLSGPLPALGPSIRYVDFSDNSLSGNIPEGFSSNSSKLRFLSLSRNNLQGDVRLVLRTCPLLTTLRLSDNGLFGQLPVSDIQCGSLQELDLSWNALDGPIPSSFPAAFPSLRYLSLAGNKLVSSIPLGLFQELPRLASLDLSSNGLSDDVPSSLFSTTGLQLVNLSHNHLTGILPLPTSACSSLQVLDVSDNHITGALPAALNQCTSLQHLALGSNLLTGEVPPELSQLHTLVLLDLSSNHLNSSIPLSITSLTVLRLGNNFLTGTIPKQIYQCARLMELNLSSNMLFGSIPGELSKLVSLHSLDLSRNSLSGSIPNELIKLASLSSFNVSHNHLDGPIPKGGVFTSFDRSSFGSNAGLCGTALRVACPMVPKPIVLNPNASSGDTDIIQPGVHKGKNRIVLSVSAIVAISAAAVIALGIVVVSVLNIHAQGGAPAKSKLLMADSHSTPTSPSEDFAVGKLVMFTDGQETSSDELLPSAHTLLNKEHEIGRGGFGVVYRAALSDGRTFAVKKLSMPKSQLEFEKEAQLLGKIQHPNLVALQGYYWTTRMQLLIYDFIPNGSLYSRLHERVFGEPPLSWPERLHIALGTAKGLAQLHQAQVIHYDLKSNNVLLGAKNRPVISDYGLANLLPVLDRFAISSKFQGALGYMAPEFTCQSMKVNEKCDVYGFGIILLELVTGRRPVEYMEDDVVILCDYVRALLNEGRPLSCVEPGLEDCPEDQLLPVIKLGLVCSSPVPSNRPCMSEVVQILELVRPLGDTCSSS